METTPKSIEKFYSTGKRKTAIARVYLFPQGKGNIQINQENIRTYFPRPTSQMLIHQPFALTKTDGQFDVYVNVSGGGKSGQADAIRYGISKALIQFKPEFRKILKVEGLLTRDARIVERKKAGQSGARKRYQYSKR